MPRIAKAIMVTFALLLFATPARPQAQPQPSTAQTKYPVMAPLDDYLMERNAEIALARTAAPPSISNDADVLVLGRHGFETAVRGKNSFACLVLRSWSSDINDPDFWNPKLRAPICFNPQAVRSNLPIHIKKTEFILAGQSKAQMSDSIKAAFDKKELPSPDPLAMCYMMSKEQYLGDQYTHFMPHLMFFVPPTQGVTWGADLAGSPVRAYQDVLEGTTVFVIVVGKWSDGTPATLDHH